MSYKPAGSYYGQFTTQRVDTGVATDADALPGATATRNGTDDGAFALTVAKIDTGRYKVTGTIPAGYAAGDVVQVSVAATVAAVTGKAVIDSFVVDAKRNADLHDFDPAGDQVDVGSVGGTNVTGPDDLKADVTTWTTGEREQIRLRLGLDGDKTTPTSTGDLPDIKTIVQAGRGE